MAPNSQHQPRTRQAALVIVHLVSMDLINVGSDRTRLSALAQVGSHLGSNQPYDPDQNVGSPAER